MPDPIIVVSTVDDAYLPFAAVVAQSIAAKAVSGRPIEYRIFHSGTDSSMAARLAAFRPGPVRVAVTSVDNALERFGVVSGLPPATLLRLLLPSMMPDDRIIYLDTDLVVLGDIAELAAFDLRGKPIAGVTGMGSVLAARRDDPYRLPPSGWTAREHLEIALGLAATRYRDSINGGVLVMDLVALRTIDFTTRAIALLENCNDVLPFRDQDVMNILLKDRMTLLDPAWNVENIIMGLKTFASADAEDLRILKRQLSAPKCFHYAGAEKPWRQSRMLPLSGLWWHLARQTPLYPEIVRVHRAALRERHKWPNPLRPIAMLMSSMRQQRGAPHVLHHKALGALA